MRPHLTVRIKFIDCLRSQAEIYAKHVDDVVISNKTG